MTKMTRIDNPAAQAAASDYRGQTLEIMELVGNKWTLLLTYHLGERALRFSDLKRLANPISSKMLTQTLRELERFGMINRRVLSTTPPSVEYELTELGRTFLSAAGVICAWTRDNSDALEAARKRYERAEKS
jgi:DNA-binding HxlR family transcriptional regulator